MNEKTTVVIAEDESIIRLDLKEILEEEGYQVVGEASNGEQAYELISALEPRLAILDVKMPRMDGLEVAKKVSEQKKTAVLLLTAFSQRDLIDKAREAGVLAYLVKPFQKSELVPAIELALARFDEARALASEIKDLNERLKVRRILDEAKGILIDKYHLQEAEAHRFIQKASMDQRKPIVEIAKSVVSGALSP